MTVDVDPKILPNGQFVYNKYWLAKETPAFNTWWETEYGTLESYLVGEFADNETTNEYFIRKSFALMGWLGSLK